MSETGGTMKGENLPKTVMMINVVAQLGTVVGASSAILIEVRKSE